MKTLVDIGWIEKADQYKGSSLTYVLGYYDNAYIFYADLDLRDFLAVLEEEACSRDHARGVDTTSVNYSVSIGTLKDDMLLYAKSWFADRMIVTGKQM